MSRNNDLIIVAAGVLLIITLVALFAGQQVTNLLSRIGLGGASGEIGALVVVLAFVFITLSVLDRI